MPMLLPHWWLLTLHLLTPGLGVSTVQTLSSSSADLLFANIYNSLHSSVNPPKINGTFNVTFDMAIAQILEVNEKKQSIALLIWRRMSWYDTRLAWQGRTFGSNLTFDDIKMIKVQNDRIWKPDLVVYTDIRRTEISWSFHFATINSDGRVTLNTPQLIDMSCSIDVTNFPYDKQVCRMKIGSWAMDGLELNLLNISSQADLAGYEEDNEYCLVGAPVTRNVIKYNCCEAPFVDLTYDIFLQRKPLYYEINLIMPCIIILIVALFAFCLPPESGERISLCVTVLLALSVFLQLANENTPTQSDVVPLISRYFMAAICMSSLCVIGSVFSLMLHFCGRQDRPMGLRTELCFRLLCRLVCYPGFQGSGASKQRHLKELPSTVLSQKIGSSSAAADISLQNVPPPHMTAGAIKSPPLPHLTRSLPSEIVDLLSRIDDALYGIHQEISRSRDSKLRERLWEDAAQAVDRLMFVTSAVAFVVFAAAVFVNRPSEAISAAANCGQMRAAFARA